MENNNVLNVRELHNSDIDLNSLLNEDEFKVYESDFLSRTLKKGYYVRFICSHSADNPLLYSKYVYFGSKTQSITIAKQIIRAYAFKFFNPFVGKNGLHLFSRLIEYSYDCKYSRSETFSLVYENGVRSPYFCESIVIFFK